MNMIRPLRSIIAVALAGITSITLANGTSTAPATTPSGIEIDVIFPIHNATYNITESLPIVFALQNLSAIAALGPFTFSWDIMPYGKVGENQEPGGVLNDYWETTFTSANATTEPYILVNQTNVRNWQFGPWYPDGSVYALQWGISWSTKDDPIKPCDSDPLGVFGQLFFNINITRPEPDLGTLIGQCAQLGGVFEINTTAKNSSCSAVVSNGGNGDPCAITLDKAMVGSISSAVQSLSTASAAASASATARPSPPLHNIAVSSDVPLRYMLVATFLLVSFQMAMAL
jgi:hypothetical protein